MHLYSHIKCSGRKQKQKINMPKTIYFFPCTSCTKVLINRINNAMWFFCSDQGESTICDCKGLWHGFGDRAQSLYKRKPRAAPLYGMYSDVQNDRCGLANSALSQIKAALFLPYRSHVFRGRSMGFPICIGRTAINTLAASIDVCLVSFM